MQTNEPQFQPLAGFGLTPEGSAPAGQQAHFALPPWPTGQQVAPQAGPMVPMPTGAQPGHVPPMQQAMPPFQKPMQAPQPAQQPPMPQGMPQFQKPMQAPPQQQPAPSQAAPVAPVACPTYTPPAGHQSQPQSAQQALARQLTGIARALEQTIPGYQIMISVLQEVLETPRGQALPGAQIVGDLAKDAVFHHFSALGAIRRFLCGEASTEVMTALALNLNRLMALHNQVRPLIERMVMGAPPELRPAMTGLSQLLTPGGAQLTQAVTATQQLVGPRIWESAQPRAGAAREATPPASPSEGE